MQGIHLIGLRDLDLHRKIVWIRRVPLDSWVEFIQHFDLVTSEPHIKESHRFFHRLHDLGYCSRYQAMIRVSVTAIWAKSHNCIRFQLCKGDSQTFSPRPERSELGGE